ncbi:MAG: hypothetical protein ACKO0Z_27950 [Betaproteobacteria bacterium]
MTTTANANKVTGRRSLFSKTGSDVALPALAPEMGAKINRRPAPARAIAVNPDEIRVAFVGAMTPQQRDAIAAFYAGKDVVRIPVCANGSKPPIEVAVAHGASVICLPREEKTLAKLASEKGLAVITG